MPRPVLLGTDVLVDFLRGHAGAKRQALTLRRHRVGMAARRLRNVYSHFFRIGALPHTSHMGVS